MRAQCAHFNGCNRGTVDECRKAEQRRRAGYPGKRFGSRHVFHHLKMRYPLARQQKHGATVLLAKIAASTSTTTDFVPAAVLYVEHSAPGERPDQGITSVRSTTPARHPCVLNSLPRCTSAGIWPATLAAELCIEGHGRDSADIVNLKAELTVARRRNAGV
jgi:hypothetical protein